MKVIKNKFFLICLCIAVVICTVSTTFSLMGYAEPVRNVLGVVATPFRWCAVKVTDAAEGFFKHFSLQGALLDKNAALEAENESLRAEQLRLQMIEEENRRLRSYLGMKESYPDFLFEEGMVLSSEASGYLTVFTLNRGSLHGIAVNMPVIVQSGVVGYVTEVGLNWCKVCTILEKDSSIGAYIAGSGYTGMVKGKYSSANDGICQMVYIQENAVIEVGDVVLSSGMGSVYPADLVIGTVESLEYDAYNHTMIANVRTSADFQNLQYMMIVTGYENGAVVDYQTPSAASAAMILPKAYGETDGDG